jgi:hypothetical protein
MLLDGAHPGLIQRAEIETTTAPPFELKDAHPALLTPIENKTEVLESEDLSKVQIPLNQDLAESVSSVLSQIASEISINSVVSFDKTTTEDDNLVSTISVDDVATATTGLPLSWLKNQENSTDKSVTPLILNFKLQNKPRPFQKPTESPDGSIEELTKLNASNVEDFEVLNQTTSADDQINLIQTESATALNEMTTVGRADNNDDEILDGQASSSTKTKLPNINSIPSVEKLSERTDGGLVLNETTTTTESAVNVTSTEEPVSVVNNTTKESQDTTEALSTTSYEETTTTTTEQSEGTEETSTTDNVEMKSSEDQPHSSNLVAAADNQTAELITQYSNRPAVQQHKPVYIKPSHRDPVVDKPLVQPAVINLDRTSDNGAGLEASVTRLDEDVRTFVELCNELAFSLWSSITHNGISSARSLVLSPFATTSLLAMVFLGARGPTSGQMNEVLKLDDMVTFNPHLVFRNVTESVIISRNPGVATATFVRELYSDRVS